jgi:integrase
MIKEFVDFKRGSVTEKRLSLIHNSLVKFGDLLEIDFDKASKDDITKAWNIILSSEQLTVKTKQDEYLHIRQVYKHWFGDDEEFPKIVRGMKRPKGRSRLVLPEEMPDEDVIHRAIKACRNPRDRFFIAYEGLDAGARPVELRSLQWKNLKKDDHSYYFRVWTAKQSGESDYRPIRVIFSEPYLLEWMKLYPGERKDDQYVFCDLSQPDKPITHNVLTRLFMRLKKNLGLKGKFSPYILRHATLTRMGKNPNVSEAVLKKFAGHTQSSSIIGEYQHYGGDDVKEMQLGYAGKEIHKQEKSYELKKIPIKCPHCGKANAWDAEICGFCNFALSQKRHIEIEEFRKRTEKLEKEKEETNKLIKELIKKIS